MDPVVDEAGIDGSPLLDGEAVGLASAADADGVGALDAPTGAALVQPTLLNATLMTARPFDSLVAARQCNMP